jgi:hypothetical protein
MAHLHLGQYRKIEYTDDGCSRYQCMWCKGCVEIRDDPKWGWNFCPKCGKSWFEPMACRRRHTPRWSWDRYKGNYDATVMTTEGEKRVGECEHPWHYQPSKATKKWIIERRVMYRREPLGEWYDWEQVREKEKDPYAPDWQWAWRALIQEREWNQSDEHRVVEHRVRLVPKT